MLNLYARTFMIATMTDAMEAGSKRTDERPRQRGSRTWLGGAWRRIAGRA